MSHFQENIGQAKAEFLDKTHALIKQQTDAKKRDLIFEIRAIFFDVFGEADKRELKRINQRLKNIGNNPNISQPQIPH